jgi:hypothetical protein
MVLLLTWLKLILLLHIEGFIVFLFQEATALLEPIILLFKRPTQLLFIFTMVKEPPCVRVLDYNALVHLLKTTRFGILVFRLVPHAFERRRFLLLGLINGKVFIRLDLFYFSGLFLFWHGVLVLAANFCLV